MRTIKCSSGDGHCGGGGDWAAAAGDEVAAAAAPVAVVGVWLRLPAPRNSGGAPSSTIDSSAKWLSVARSYRATGTAPKRPPPVTRPPIEQTVRRDCGLGLYWRDPPVQRTTGRRWPMPRRFRWCPPLLPPPLPPPLPPLPPPLLFWPPPQQCPPRRTGPAVRRRRGCCPPPSRAQPGAAAATAPWPRGCGPAAANNEGEGARPMAAATMAAAPAGFRGPRAASRPRAATPGHAPARSGARGHGQRHPRRPGAPTCALPPPTHLLLVEGEQDGERDVLEDRVQEIGQREGERVEPGPRKIRLKGGVALGRLCPGIK